jgi:hypothetical protein
MVVLPPLSGEASTEHTKPFVVFADVPQVAAAAGGG